MQVGEKFNEDDLKLLRIKKMLHQTANMAIINYYLAFSARAVAQAGFNVVDLHFLLQSQTCR